MSKGYRINLENDNNKYLESFRKIKAAEEMKPICIHQYTSRVGQLATAINKDLFDMSLSDYEQWVTAGNEIKKNFVTAFFKTMLKHNVNDYQNRINKDFLFYLAIN